MKESYWGYWLLVLGVFIIVVLLLVQSFTSTNTQDYYMVKTITEAAMEDAIDYSYYRTYGEAKINKEKFFESFLRRFAEEASLATTYHISFSDIYEAPPKVSVTVSSKAGGFAVVGNKSDIDIVNRIDAILESTDYIRSDEYAAKRVTSYQKFAKNFDLKTEIADSDLRNKAERVMDKTIPYTFSAADNVKDSCYGRQNTKVYGCGYPKAAVSGEYDMSDVYCIIISTSDNACVAAMPVSEAYRLAR